MPAAEMHRNGWYGGGVGPIVLPGVLLHPTIAMRFAGSRLPGQ